MTNQKKMQIAAMNAKGMSVASLPEKFTEIFAFRLSMLGYEVRREKEAGHD